MKICIIDSTFPINTRTKKIEESLVSYYGRNSVSVIAWNRDGREYENKPYEYIYVDKAAYGSKIQKLLKIKNFKRYIKKCINSSKFDYLIASHWDVLYLTSKVTSKKNIIYDNLDIPTHDNIVVLKFLQVLERIALKKCCAIIFASRFFIPLYDYDNGVKILLENKPSKKLIPTIRQIHAGKIRITFLGVIRYFDILKNLVSALEGMNSFELIFYGDGPDLKKLQNFVKEKKNIILKGRYDNSILQNIYDESDIIWAVYPNKDYNVKYAMSNKFHESIMLNKPCVFAKNTKLGDFVEENYIGLTVDPYSIEDIRGCFEKIQQNDRILNEIQGNLELFSKGISSWDVDVIQLQKIIGK